MSANLLAYHNLGTTVLKRRRVTRAGGCRPLYYYIVFMLKLNFRFFMNKKSLHFFYQIALTRAQKGTASQAATCWDREMWNFTQQMSNMAKTSHCPNINFL